MNSPLVSINSADVLWRFRRSLSFGWDNLFKPDVMMGETISWDDFIKVQIRVGTIVEVKDFPKARNPAYRMKIDFGPDIGVRKTSAQITERYEIPELLGRQIVAVVNFPKKQIADFMSECLVLGAVDGSDVVLLAPEQAVPNGLRIG